MFSIGIACITCAASALVGALCPFALRKLYLAEQECMRCNCDLCMHSFLLRPATEVAAQVEQLRRAANVLQFFGSNICIHDRFHHHTQISGTSDNERLSYVYSPYRGVIDKM